MNNHKVYLYKPGGTASDFLGELLVDNLNVNIKLHDMSTISFTIPEKVNNTPNIRLDEVLDGYIVELWYGQVDGVYNPPSQKDFEKIRFVLHKTPLDFNDFKRIYSYEGHSIESNLELRQITNWRGVFVPDFYRLITYNNSTPNQYTEVAATGETIPNHPYSVTAKTTPNTGKYIRIAPTTATATPLDIYVYEIREDTDPSAEKYNEIAYVRYTGSTYDESGFKQGYYFLDLDANQEYVEYIYIYVPDKYDDFDGETYKKLRFKVYDNPISRHYAVGVNRNSENPFTDYYIDLAQDVEDGDPAEYGDYTFTTQKIRSKNGLKLEHVLLGNIETRDISNNIDNNTLTDDGLLYHTDFTIGTIHPTIAAKYRSNLEFNNITVYQAIKDIAESFDAIAVFDTIAKTVSFYPENADTWPNNGLILKYGTYLKNISKDIDASKIVTAAKGVGKDNSGIELITPDGNDYWEDFSYYLDEFYIDKDLTLAQLYAAGFTFTLQNPSDNVYYLGISYPNSDNTDSFQSRWMDAAEAKKLAKWQFNRDFLHKVLLGEILPSVADNTIGVNLSVMDRFYDLYNIRSKAINDYVQSDTVLSIRKAEYFRYKYLYDFYDKKVNLGGASVDEEERYLYYKNLWQEAQTAVAAQEVTVENKRLAIFTTTVADSIGDKLGEVRTALNKNTTFSVDLDKLNSFIKEAVVTDSKLDNDLDLLDAVITHVDENKIPRVTLNVGIVNILAAQESYDDWNKLRVGDLVNVYFPEFNIDEEIQIREVGIDFEQHTASLVIASVRNYNKSRANYTSKNLKKLLTANRNDLNNIEDAARVSSNESQDTYNKLNGGTINATNSVIAFGTKDTSDNYGNKIDGSGASLSVVSNVDPITETFQFSSNKSLFILDGSVQSFYDEGNYVTQVEVSGENGFIIRRITGDVETDTLNVEKLMYITTDGDAVFSGFLSIGQLINDIGYNKTGIFAGYDGTDYKLSIKSDNGSFLYDGSNIQIGRFTLSSDGLAGSGYTRVVSSLLRTYNTELDYYKFYIKQGVAGPNTDYQEAYVEADQVVTSYYDAAANPIISPSVTESIKLEARGATNKLALSYNLQNSGTNNYSASISIVPEDDFLPDAGGTSVVVKVPFDNGTIALLETNQTFTGDIIIGGNLTVNGTTTTLNTENLNVEDKNIILGNVATPNDTTASGGGITLKGATDKTIIWNNATAGWEFNQTITTTGNIGIGTTSPLNVLDIRITGADSNDGIIIARADSITVEDDILGGIGFDSTDGNTPSSVLEASAYIAAFAAENQGTLDKGGYLTFGTAPINQDDDTLSSERMRITSEGDVGIGIISPAAKLDVVGNIKHTGLVMSSGTNVDQLQTTTFTSALTTSWTDVTGVSGTYLATGSYIVQIESNGEYYTGNMTWFSGTTTSTVADEIVLHRAGPAASAARIYARVIRTSSSPSTLKLQVSASTSVSSHTLTFKFRRTI